MVITQTRRPIDLRPLLITLCVIVVAFAIGHAISKHGTEALAIKFCIEDNGAAMTWVNKKDPNKQYLCTQLPDGRWGLLIRLRVEDEWRNLTAFVRRDGTLGKLKAYLEAFATLIQ